MRDSTWTRRVGPSEGNAVMLTSGRNINDYRNGRCARGW
jgi:hypothetical protein